MTDAGPTETPGSDRVPRIGLVLGAGGVAGGAFHSGVLGALQEATGWDPRTAAIIVGTSAGSVTAASLRSGLSAADMLARAEGRPLSGDGAKLLSSIRTPAAPPLLTPDNGPRRSRSELAALFRRAARSSLSARPLAVIASLVPDGTVSTEFIAAGIGAFVPDEWPPEALWVCAVRQRDGRRVVFGRDSIAPVPLAVAASCAIPRVFRPVVVDGESYLDGGVHSPTNADVLANAALDLVLVSSPMSVAGRSVRLAADEPFRRWSRAVLDGEAVRLRRTGTHVIALQPTREDLEVIGLDSMDPKRRGPVARQVFESTLRRLARADTRRRLAILFRTS